MTTRAASTCAKNTFDGACDDAFASACDRAVMRNRTDALMTPVRNARVAKELRQVMDTDAHTQALIDRLLATTTKREEQGNTAEDRGRTVCKEILRAESRVTPSLRALHHCLTEGGRRRLSAQPVAARRLWCAAVYPLGEYLQCLGFVSIEDLARLHRAAVRPAQLAQQQQQDATTVNQNAGRNDNNNNNNNNRTRRSKHAGPRLRFDTDDLALEPPTLRRHVQNVLDTWRRETAGKKEPPWIATAAEGMRRFAEAHALAWNTANAYAPSMLTTSRIQDCTAHAYDGMARHIDAATLFHTSSRLPGDVDADTQHSYVRLRARDNSTRAVDAMPRSMLVLGAPRHAGVTHGAQQPIQTPVLYDVHARGGDAIARIAPVAAENGIVVAANDTCIAQTNTQLYYGVDTKLIHQHRKGRGGSIRDGDDTIGVSEVVAPPLCAYARFLPYPVVVEDAENAKEADHLRFSRCETNRVEFELQMNEIPPCTGASLCKIAFVDAIDASRRDSPRTSGPWQYVLSTQRDPRGLPVALLCEGRILYPRLPSSSTPSSSAAVTDALPGFAVIARVGKSKVSTVGHEARRATQLAYCIHLVRSRATDTVGPVRVRVHSLATLAQIPNHPESRGHFWWGDSADDAFRTLLSPDVRARPPTCWHAFTLRCSHGEVTETLKRRGGGMQATTCTRVSGGAVRDAVQQLGSADVTDNTSRCATTQRRRNVVLISHGPPRSGKTTTLFGTPPGGSRSTPATEKRQKQCYGQLQHALHDIVTTGRRARLYAALELYEHDEHGGGRLVYYRLETPAATARRYTDDAVLQSVLKEESANIAVRNLGRDLFDERGELRVFSDSTHIARVQQILQALHTYRRERSGHLVLIFAVQREKNDLTDPDWLTAVDMAASTPSSDTTTTTAVTMPTFTALSTTHLSEYLRHVRSYPAHPLYLPRRTTAIEDHNEYTTSSTRATLLRPSVRQTLDSYAMQCRNRYGSRESSASHEISALRANIFAMLEAMYIVHNDILATTKRFIHRHAALCGDAADVFAFLYRKHLEEELQSMRHRDKDPLFWDTVADALHHVFASDSQVHIHYDDANTLPVETTLALLHDALYHTKAWQNWTAQTKQSCSEESPIEHALQKAIRAHSARVRLRPTHMHTINHRNNDSRGDDTDNMKMETDLVHAPFVLCCPDAGMLDTTTISLQMAQRRAWPPALTFALMSASSDSRVRAIRVPFAIAPPRTMTTTTAIVPEVTNVERRRRGERISHNLCPTRATCKMVPLLQYVQWLGQDRPTTYALIGTVRAEQSVDYMQQPQIEGES